jgi:hypothetical protein
MNERWETELGKRLERERPTPSSAFVEDLRRSLADGAPPSSSQPTRQIVMLTAVGAALLLIVAAGIVGLGPLDAS